MEPRQPACGDVHPRRDSVPSVSVVGGGMSNEITGASRLVFLDVWDVMRTSSVLSVAQSTVALARSLLYEGFNLWRATHYELLAARIDVDEKLALDADYELFRSWTSSLRLH